MKNLKLLPLIALLGLVSACSNDAKEPVFGTEGDVVVYSIFNGRLQAAKKECELFKEDILKDRTLKTTYIFSRTATVKSGTKEKVNYSSKSTVVREEQYDFDTNVVKETSNSTEVEKVKSLEENIQQNNSGKTEFYYQFNPVEGLEYLVRVNALYKTYYREAETTESTVEEKHQIMDSRMKNTTIASAYDCFLSHYPSSDNTRNHLFYANNTIFTITYHEEARQNNSDSNGTVTTDRKVQIDFAEGKEAVRFTETIKTNLTYTKNTNNYVTGDVVNITEKTCYDYSIVKEEVSLNQLNLQKYSYVAD